MVTNPGAAAYEQIKPIIKDLGIRDLLALDAAVKKYLHQEGGVPRYEQTYMTCNERLATADSTYKGGLAQFIQDRRILWDT